MMMGNLFRNASLEDQGAERGNIITKLEEQTGGGGMRSRYIWLRTGSNGRFWYLWC
jgi:hypothetical protein